MRLEFHVVSVSVRDATCLGIALSLSAYSPSRSGQDAAKTSYVSRPRSKASAGSSSFSA